MGVPLLAKIQMSLELLAFFLCLLTIVGQFGLLDYYFVLYMNDKIWWLWIIADLLVLAIMTWLLYLAFNYSKKCMRETCSDDSNVRYAFLAWLCYSTVLSAKVATMFNLFSDRIVKDQIFGPNVLKLVLSCSAVVYLFLVLSHHYNKLNSPRQTYLSYLASGVTLDVIDSVLFLQLLIDPELKDLSKKHIFLPGAVIFFACFNFVLPTFALFKLRYTRRLPHWMPLPYEKVYTLFYFLTVNLPFLIIRAYVWQKDKNDVSIFIVKNFVMVILAFREVWVSYLQWKENGGYFTKKHNKNDDSSASSNSNQVNQAYYGGDNPRNNKIGDNVCSL